MTADEFRRALHPGGADAREEGEAAARRVIELIDGVARDDGAIARVLAETPPEGRRLWALGADGLWETWLRGPFKRWRGRRSPNEPAVNFWDRLRPFPRLIRWLSAHHDPGHADGRREPRPRPALARMSRPRNTLAQRLFDLCRRINRRLPVALQSALWFMFQLAASAVILPVWIAWFFWRALFDGARRAAVSIRRETQTPAAAAPPAPAPAKPGRFDAVIATIVEAYRARKDLVDRLSGHYAGLHRSSFVAIALLGVAAVLLGVLASMAGGAGDSHHGSHRGNVLVTAELIVLLAMIGIYVINRTRGWHTKAVEYRLAAELLRGSRDPALAGIRLPGVVDPGPQYTARDVESRWVETFHKLAVRQINHEVADGFAADPPIAHSWHTPAYRTACRRHVIKGWMSDQIRYHCRLARDYAAMLWLLEWVARWSLASTFIVAALHFTWHPFPGWLAVMPAVLPALGAAATSIIAQGELHRLGDRSRTMARTLARVRDRLKSLKDEDDLASAEEFKRLVEQAADVMLAEVSEWRVIFRFTTIREPG